MIVRYPETDIMRLLLIVIPTVLMLSSILTADSAATSNTATTPATIFSVLPSPPATSTVINTPPIECCTPILLVPIATSGNNVYVVWSGNDTGHFEISFRASSDNGQTFTDKINLSNTPSVDSIDPHITASGNHVYISWWEDYGNGTRVPFFKASNDNGITFEPVLSLSDNAQ